jgi:hypothetical protein
VDSLFGSWKSLPALFLEWVKSLPPLFLDWWGSLPPHIQTPLIQALGAFASAGIALTGVILTLAWNRHKQRQDRDLALKKDVFVSFLTAVTGLSQGWFNFAGEEPAHDLEKLSLAQIAIRLVANRDSREAVGAIGPKLDEMANANRAARSELKLLHQSLTEENRNALTDEQRARLEAMTSFFFDRQKALKNEMLERFRAFTPLFNDCIRKFRLELGISEDARWFESRQEGKVTDPFG